ncbi:ATP-dependent endonuclease [Paenibacillus sp. W2I17]|uniref:ATP-dependent nuclease n=1 Tax=Paenibacillus sp. W2I17 TaxID=3042311 RepID=UPI002785F6FD|nr:ATP-binding protein [Paenibacillus sp. W2I17]MDQ0659480.1 putative ATPase [Paenibacillus sp. W2I17]
MRTARAGDYWRELYNKPFKFKVSKVFFQNLKGVGSGNVDFLGGITAICGGNGVGKSTLLNAISSVLSSERLASDKSISVKLEGAELVGEFIDSGSSLTRKVNVISNKVEAEPSAISVESVWIDGSIQAPKLIEIFSNMPNLSEFLESEEARVASEEERAFLSYIVGKDYSRCETYELDLETYGTVPYFKVKSDGVEYGSEAMGLGEISLHYILWNLHRLDKNSVVLMEEPETYLAPRSQEALLDVIAKIAADKRLWIILTTHSPSIVKNIPIEHVRILSRVNESVEISTPSNGSQYMYSLGLKPQKLGAILVEDRCARELTKCWLARFNPSIIQEYEIVDIGSKGKIIQQVKEFPFIGPWFKLVGMFDGNERGKINMEDNHWNYSYLPSEVAPEQLLKEIAKSMRRQLAEISGRELQRINSAIHSLDGRDHHDWIVEFPRQIGLSYEQLIAFLFEISMDSESYRELYSVSYQDFVEVLEKSFNKN